MKKLLFAFIVLFAAQAVCAQHPSTDPRWTLVFEDNFTDATASEAYWWPCLPDYTYLVSYNSATNSCVFAGDIQSAAMMCDWPGNDNVEIDETAGIATLHVLKTSTPYTQTYICNDGNGDVYTDYTVNYTAGALVSRETYKYQYGYFEIRFKVPENFITRPNYDSYGPNFWLFGQTNNPIIRREIDLMESAYEGNSLLYTNCTHYYDLPDPQLYREHGMQTNVWHTVACNWTPDKIDFYLDGRLTRTEENWWVPHLGEVSMKMLVGISTPNMFDNLYIVPLNDANSLPSFDYYIDYIKVWQLDQNCTSYSDETICSSPIPANGTNVYRRVITDASCTTTFNTAINLKATDYIIFGENTTITDDADQSFEVDDCMDY